jgi:membrane protein implicated in regulation of membrane protease activity
MKMFKFFQALPGSLDAHISSEVPICEYEGKIDKIIESGKVWRVYHKATFWFARSQRSVNFHIGDFVRVVGRRGTVLLIEPEPQRHVYKGD